ncbi:DNA polymerase III subunit delta' [Staphylospora marina]|uniref:DNA polymerase III subunit delta' n=1 Tax=Staphylospora marina TaxID=2490858 RepID=UPI000F5C0FD4|nr:DNA polymerase III subunit delta' [Staphylospora marina]
MSWSALKHQPGALRMLTNALKTGRVAHAYCFHGPAGSGKKAAALELAKAVNCLEGREEACDQCVNCRRIDHGNHPDVVTLTPEGTVIRIDQLRALQQQFRYGAPPGVTRVVIMEEADKMRAEAANSLLKFLEEPSSPMIAVLITDQADSILPTILSRCQKVRFREPDPDHKEVRLSEEGVPDEWRRILAHLPDEAANRFREQPDAFCALVRRVIEWAGEILAGSSTALLPAQEEATAGDEGKHRLPLIMDLLVLWFRDLTRLRSGIDEPVFAGWKEELDKQSRLLPPARLLIALENALDTAVTLKRAHLQPQPVLEQMVLATQAGIRIADPEE